MKLVRARIVAGFLFCLITLGQAYPFSVAWGMYRNNHPCCCETTVAKPCDCDHGGHSSPKKNQKNKKFSCHEEAPETGARYTKAPCGTATEASFLNFRGETCLPRFTAFAIVEIGIQHDAPFVIKLPELSFVPEGPPPRSVLPS